MSFFFLLHHLKYFNQSASPSESVPGSSGTGPASPPPTSNPESRRNRDRKQIIQSVQVFMAQSFHINYLSGSDDAVNVALSLLFF